VIQLRMRPGMRIVSVRQDALTIEQHGYVRKLRGIRGLEPAFRLLRRSAADLDVLREQIARTGPPGGSVAGVDRLGQALGMLVSACVVELACMADGDELLVAAPVGPLASFDFSLCGVNREGAAPVAGAKEAQARDVAAGRFQLSRFACAHRVAENLVVDCPHRSVRVTVTASEAAAVITALAEPSSAAGLAARLPFISPAVVQDVLDFLAAVGAAAQVGPGGRLAEDCDPNLAQREFHDVLMHSRSRYGLTDGPLGGVFPHAGVIPSSPAVKPVMAEPLIDLPRPDMDQLMAADPPLARVMEMRRSVRAYGNQKLRVDEVGEFLYRVARVRAVAGPHPDDQHGYETSDRPYPSGGAGYDLEIYPLVHECEGIPPGLYHYQPLAHAVSKLPCEPAMIQRQLRKAYYANGCQVIPQVLFILASRFSRLSWKYQGIAYALTLRNVGVLYEAMYLAATAMGLAPCALGSGDSALFGAMTSLDPLVESSVGEFMLGTRP
jgi:oxazoline/thiazoline dehydrogenase